MTLSPKLEWYLANPKWAAELNPVLNNPLTNMSVIKNVQLVSGTNIINHLLGRMQQGWTLLDEQGAAVIYRNAPFNDLTLSLHCDTTVTVSIGVF